MLSVNKISGIENNYNNQNKISFQSKFVPNEALKDAFYIARNSVMFTTHRNVEDGRTFARIIDHLLNDGKNDLIKVTRSEKGSTLMINGKRVNFYPREHKYPGFVDGERVINNIINYFAEKTEIVETYKLTRDEFKAIKPAVDKLNAEVNADDVTKNPQILCNLEENMRNINVALHKHAAGLLDKLEAKIFNK